MLSSGRTQLRIRSLGLVTSIALAAWLGAASMSRARAYDLSRQDSKEDQIERFFIDVQFGVWLPGPDTFDDNHQTSLQFGGELGVKIVSASGHNLYLIGGATYSPQTLEPWLYEREANMLFAFGGVRYVPAALCASNGMACLFVEAALGLTWESAEGEFYHDPPKGALTVAAGVGYRLRVARVIELGVRIDLAYLEESYERQIGWFTPAAFAGVAF